MSFPRLRDLPKEEQAPFEEYLKGQTRPLAEGCENIPQEEWDWYFLCDYDRWKSGLSVID